MAKEIKYDGSEAEMFELGLITRDGVAIHNMRDELNLYLKEVAKRKKYREDKELIALGIVDENGKVLDQERLNQIEQERFDKQVEQETEARAASRNTPGLLRRAIEKLRAKRSHKTVNFQKGMDR